MSRFLKFIVHIVVICTTLCVLAMVLPPFWGITTEVIDDSTKETNLPMGSVTYAIPIDMNEIEAGTPLLVQTETGHSRYNVVTLDKENKTAAVVDPTKASSETIPISVGTKVPKVVITVGLIGYLLVATESIEGLIILGLAVLFLIILYVIAELWKKEPQEEFEEEDRSYIKSKKELKKEEKERSRRIKEEDKRMLQEERLRKKQEKKQRKIVKTGGFVDEVFEDELQEEEETPSANVQSATSEAHELLKKEIAAATVNEEEVEQPEAAAPEADFQEAEEALEETAATEECKETEEETPAEIRKMAIPVWTAAQLADQAKQEGDAPDIVKDDITHVTLFDYSDIIGGEDE